MAFISFHANWRAPTGLPTPRGSVEIGSDLPPAACEGPKLQCTLASIVFGIRVVLGSSLEGLFFAAMARVSCRGFSSLHLDEEWELTAAAIGLCFIVRSNQRGQSAVAASQDATHICAFLDSINSRFNVTQARVTLLFYNAIQIGS